MPKGFSGIATSLVLITVGSGKVLIAVGARSLYQKRSVSSRLDGVNLTLNRNSKARSCTMGSLSNNSTRFTQFDQNLGGLSQSIGYAV
jgi:hypothetical protein